MTLILASTSPRRQDLLARLGVPFVIEPSEVTERRPKPGEDPAIYAESLARQKARAVAARRPGAVVIGADTVVAVDGQILGKPVDEADALRMLRLLRGRKHVVVTGLAVACDGRIDAGTVATSVRMRDAPDDELRAYIATGEPMDKAGAYAVQEYGGQLVDEVRGCYNAVVGLPLSMIADLLSRCGLEFPTSVCCNFCRRS